MLIWTKWRHVLTQPNVRMRVGQHLHCTVFAVSPGAKAWAENNARQTPTGISFYRPEDITGTALFLATVASDAIFGEAIAVDGGLHAG